MSGNDYRIQFGVACEGELFCAQIGGLRVLEGAFGEGKVSVSIKYDFSERPLVLSAAARCGDNVDVHVLPYRLELYVNGVLCDEEWPCGRHGLQECSVTDHGCALRIEKTDLGRKREEPAVLGTFRGAEGWKPEENVFVGDCMPYSHNGDYHVLYLRDRHHHRSKWGCGGHQWSHISTEDFDEWRIHPMVVELDDPHEGSICTGSWICDGDTHYLFYAVRMCDGSPAEIRRSVSRDGYHYEKDRDFLLILSDRFTPPSARDPKIVRDAQGTFHMILTTSLAQSGLGCLAHLVSDDLLNWRELEQPLYVAPEGMGEPECPDYFYKNGYYYLVYSLRAKGYYLYSEAPFSGWRQAGDPVIPCKSVPKAAIWKDRLIFAGFDGKGVYAGTLTFLEAVVGADGTLTYKNPT